MDASSDGGMDAGSDGGLDAGLDGGVDAGLDGGADAGTGCTNSASCAGPLSVCDVPRGRCVACISGEGCISPNVCDTRIDGGECVRCLNNTHCSMPAPFCNQGTQNCVQCLNWYECPATAECFSNVCAPSGVFSYVERYDAGAAQTARRLATFSDGGAFGLVNSPGTVTQLDYALGTGLVDQGRSASATAIDARDLAITSTGDRLIFGHFSGSANFGGTTLTAAGANDLFVVSYAPSGTVNFARRYGASANEQAHAIGARAAGGYVIAGSGTFSLGATNINGGFVASFDAAGTLVFAQNLGTVQFAGIGERADGSVVAAGTFTGTISIWANATETSAGGSDLIFVRYTATGVLSWRTRLGHAMDETMAAMRVLPGDRVLAVGTFVQAMSFPSAGVNLTSNGSTDIYILSSNNLYDFNRWSFGGAGAETVTAFEFDGSSFGGAFAGTTANGFSIGSGTVPAGGFLIKRGQISVPWQFPLGTGANAAVINDLRLADGQLYAFGTVTGSVTVAGQPLTANGSSDVFLLRVSY